MKLAVHLTTRKPRILVIGLATIIIALLYLYTHPQILVGINEAIHSVGHRDFHIDRFSNKVVSYAEFRRLCYGNTDPQSIEDLYKFVRKLGTSNSNTSLCRRNHDLFISIYDVYLRYATIVISETFQSKLSKWLNNRKDLIESARNQSLVFITNRYTYESVVFNTVRANRPVASVVEGGTLRYIEQLITDTAKKCPLCSYRNSTATDSIGLMESEHAVITSSTFKVDTYHSIALLKTHNPIQFTQIQFIDCVNLIMKWFARVHSSAPTCPYRSMYWDILPKAGASYVHPHIHIALGDYAYSAEWNQLYFSGRKFSHEHNGLNYWESILQIHTFLGLTVPFGQATLMAYLNPQKDAELMVIAQTPCLDFFRLVYFAIRALIDDLGLYALSMGFVFPKLGADSRYGDELPMIFRVVSRGSADSPRSDIGSFGFFGTVNVNRDPFKLVRDVRKSVMKRQSEKFSFPDQNRFI